MFIYLEILQLYLGHSNVLAAFKKLFHLDLRYSDLQNEGLSSLLNFHENFDENIETINNRLLISGPDTTKPYSSICIFSSNYKHKLWQIAFINKHLTKEKEQFWPAKYPAYPLCIAKGRHDLLTYHIQAFIGKHFIFIIFYFLKMFRNT